MNRLFSKISRFQKTRGKTACYSKQPVFWKPLVSENKLLRKIASGKHTDGFLIFVFFVGRISLADPASYAVPKWTKLFPPPPPRLPFNFARGFFIFPPRMSIFIFQPHDYYLASKKCRVKSIFYLGDFR